MDPELFSIVAPELPAIIIILVVEHIAIAKSFGRSHNYTIIPSQEMIAQGAANILSPFVGGYVCTGSFGASAVLSKAAVRTPLAGLFSAGVLVLALYALTAVFYFIPNAALAGLIIHCTVNLLTPPKSLYKYWQMAPFELFVWVCGVVTAFFTNLETAVYVTVGLSFAMLLVRMAKSPGKFRGSVAVSRRARHDQTMAKSASSSSSPSIMCSREHNFGQRTEERQVFLPYDTTDGHNPRIVVEPAYPGVFIYRFSENFNYINQAHHVSYLTSHIMGNTRRTRLNDGIEASDRLWCEELPKETLLEKESSKPLLRAVVLDFSAVNIIDVTSLQGLVDLRNSLDRYAAPAVVEWHFAGVHNRWTRRALAFAGFGYPSSDDRNVLGKWSPVYTVTMSLVGATEDEQEELAVLRNEVRERDVENQQGHWPVSHTFGDHSSQKYPQPLYGVDRPFFHVDLHDAVDAAVRDAKNQDEFEARTSSATSGREGTNGVLRMSSTSP